VDAYTSLALRASCLSCTMPDVNLSLNVNVGDAPGSAHRVNHDAVSVSLRRKACAERFRQHAFIVPALPHSLSSRGPRISGDVRTVTRVGGFGLELRVNIEWPADDVQADVDANMYVPESPDLRHPLLLGVDSAKPDDFIQSAREGYYDAERSSVTESETWSEIETKLADVPVFHTIAGDVPHDAFMQKVRTDYLARHPSQALDAESARYAQVAPKMEPLSPVLPLAPFTIQDPSLVESQPLHEARAAVGVSPICARPVPHDVLQAKALQRARKWGDLRATAERTTAGS
jgi:hypothetical protein